MKKGRPFRFSFLSVIGVCIIVLYAKMCPPIDYQWMKPMMARVPIKYCLGGNLNKFTEAVSHIEENNAIHCNYKLY